MTLFESEPQYREKEVLWRVFSLLPLFGPLAGGRIFSWFAVNIPMDLGTGGAFTSDIDIIARLRDIPRSNRWLYRTWEVKVALLCRDGSARSLKTGKLRRTTTQLNAYREFGSPDVSLLDILLCEAGFLRGNRFPTPAVDAAVRGKIVELSQHGFGYQLLPFEHGRDEEGDVGLSAIQVNALNPLQTTFDIMSARPSEPRQPFLRLADRLNEFYERAKNRPGKPFHQIVFCRVCRELNLIKMKDEYCCPSCQSDLVIQS
jgi:hypothetical protein